MVIDSRRRGSDNSLLLIYVIYALIAAAFLSINVPPFQNADETNHMLRADNISRGYLIGHRFGSGDSGGIASPEIALSGVPFDPPKFHPERKVQLSMYANARFMLQHKGQNISFKNTAIYPPFLYAPSVVALWIGKMGRISVIQTLYLARLLTALCAIGLVAIALRICGEAGLGGAGLIIFALATLPMSLSLQSACSQDGPMFGVAALAAALVARSRVTRRPAGFVTLLVSLAVITAARPAYLFLALIPLVFHTGWRARIAGVFVVGLAGLAWTLAANHFVAVEMTERGVDIAAQLRVLLDPVRDVGLLLRTLDVIGWQFLNQIVGQLGWLDVVLPQWYVETALGVVILATLAGLELRSRGAVLTVSAVVLSSLSVFGLIYLSWDSVGAPLIEGVQGRYFLPLLVMLAGIGTTLVRPGGGLVWLIAVAFPLVSLGVTMRAIVLRYYLGS